MKTKAYTTLLITLLLASCSAPRVAQKTGYLVTVETPGETTASHLYNAADVDSVVTCNFSFAITGFCADSVFSASPYFIIETLGKTVYAEEKAIKNNGSLKRSKLKKQ